MQIRIRKDVKTVYLSCRGGAYNQKWVDLIESVAGKTLEVETEYLFKDQFNVGPVDGSENGLRIMASYVEEVIGDIRPLKKKCNWCGKISSYKVQECPHCKKTEYLESLGDATNAERFILEIE